MRIVAWTGALLLLLVIFGPFVVPLGKAPGTVPARELAEPDAQFFEFEGVDVHIRHAGSGSPPRILLHGFGASVFSFREVFDDWASRAETLAYDRPGFGLTERPWPIREGEPNPYSAAFNLDLLRAVIARTAGTPVVLIGNSAGGRLAIEFALAHPERVAALVLISPAVYGGGPPPLARFVLGLPQMDRLGPRLLRWAMPRFGQQGIDAAWHDPSRITRDVREGYALPLRADHWDVALWKFSQSRRAEPLAPRIAPLRALDVFVVTGDDDRIVATADSIRFANEVDAELMVVPNCGHLAHEECRSAWADELEAFLAAARGVEDTSPPGP